MGAILSKSVSVTQNMIYASAEALSTALLPDEVAQHWLYPAIGRIRDVSVIVTRGVIRAAQKDKVDRELALRNIGDKELDQYIRERMYDPFKEGERVENEIAELVGRPASSTGKEAGANGAAGAGQPQQQRAKALSDTVPLEGKPTLLREVTGYTGSGASDGTPSGR
ncbi:hypothetical protein LTR95_016053 [Oleoguttula sp. CCFEE 5521]